MDSSLNNEEVIYHAVKSADNWLRIEAMKEAKKKRNSQCITNNSSGSSGISYFGSKTLSSIENYSRINESSLSMIEDIEMPSLNGSTMALEKLVSLSDSCQNLSPFNEPNQPDKIVSFDKPVFGSMTVKISRNEDNMQKHAKLSESSSSDRSDGKGSSDAQNSSSSKEFQTSLMFSEAEKVLEALHSEKENRGCQEFSPPNSRLTILDLSSLNDSLLETPKSKMYQRNATQRLVDIPKMSTPKNTGSNRTTFKQNLDFNGTYNKETPLKKGVFEENSPQPILNERKTLGVNTTFDANENIEGKGQRMYDDCILGKTKRQLNTTCPTINEAQPLVVNTTFEKDKESADEEMKKLNATFENLNKKTLIMNATFEKEKEGMDKGKRFNTTYDAESKESSPKGNLNQTFEVVGKGVFLVEGKTTSLMDMEAKDLDTVLNSGKNTPVKRRSFSFIDDSKKLCLTTLHKRLSLLGGLQSQDIGAKREFDNDREKHSVDVKSEESKDLKNPLSKVDSYQTMARLTKEQALTRLRKKPKVTSGMSGPMKAIPIASAITGSSSDANKEEIRERAVSTPLNSLFLDRVQQIKKGSEKLGGNDSNTNKCPLPSFGSVSSVGTEGSNSNELKIESHMFTPEVFRSKELRAGPQITSTPAMESNKFVCDLKMNCAPTPIACHPSKAFRLFREMVNSSGSDLEGRNLNFSTLKIDNLNDNMDAESSSPHKDVNNFNANLNKYETDLKDGAEEEESKLAEIIPKAGVTGNLGSSKELKELKHEDVLASTAKEEIPIVYEKKIKENSELKISQDYKKDPIYYNSENCNQDSIITEYEMLAVDNDSKYSSKNGTFEVKSECELLVSPKKLNVEFSEQSKDNALSDNVYDIEPMKLVTSNDSLCEKQKFENLESDLKENITMDVEGSSHDKLSIPNSISSNNKDQNLSAPNISETEIIVKSENVQKVNSSENEILTIADPSNKTDVKDLETKTKEFSAELEGTRQLNEIEEGTYESEMNRKPQIESVIPENINGNINLEMKSKSSDVDTDNLSKDSRCIETSSSVTEVASKISSNPTSAEPKNSIGLVRKTPGSKPPLKIVPSTNKTSSIKKEVRSSNFLRESVNKPQQGGAPSKRISTINKITSKIDNKRTSNKPLNTSVTKENSTESNNTSSIKKGVRSTNILRESFNKPQEGRAPSKRISTTNKITSKIDNKKTLNTSVAKENVTECKNLKFRRITSDNIVQKEKNFSMASNARQDNLRKSDSGRRVVPQTNNPVVRPALKLMNRGSNPSVKPFLRAKPGFGIKKPQLKSTCKDLQKIEMTEIKPIDEGNKESRNGACNLSTSVCPVIAGQKSFIESNLNKVPNSDKLNTIKKLSAQEGENKKMNKKVGLVGSKLRPPSNVKSCISASSSYRK